MTDPAAERLRVACHEGAHFVVGYLLLGEVAGVVTIRPVAAHRGATIGPALRFDSTGHDREAPLALAAPDLRRRVETALLYVMAGDAVDDVVAPWLGRLPPPSEDAVAAEVAALRPALAELLAAAEARPEDPDPFAGDRADAQELAFLLVGMRAGPFLEFMRAEARAYVTAHAASIAAVAEELAARTIVPGSDLAAIVDRKEAATRQSSPTITH